MSMCPASKLTVKEQEKGTLTNGPQSLVCLNLISVYT